MTSAMKETAITVKKNGDILVIGKTPQLVVDLKTQNNYIQMGSKRIPYRKQVLLSGDLLRGRRKNVFRTAIQYHYEAACNIAQGSVKAEQYREKANVTTRQVVDKE